MRRRPEKLRLYYDDGTTNLDHDIRWVSAWEVRPAQRDEKEKKKLHTTMPAGRCVMCLYKRLREYIAWSKGLLLNRATWLFSDLKAFRAMEDV